MVRHSYYKGRVVGVFKQGDCRYHIIVRLSEKFFGDYLVELNPRGRWHEVTAFEVGGVWPEIIRWLRGKENVVPHPAPLPA